MRSCIYCGRTLEKNEKCTCSQSVKSREAKNAAKNQTNNNANDNVYTTGYTKHEKKHFKMRFKRKKAHASRVSEGITSMLRQFFKNPVAYIANPSYLTPVQITLLIVMQSVIIAVSIILTMLQVVQKIFVTLAGGIAGLLLHEHNITDFIALTGIAAIINIVGIFMFIGTFYLINRFIIKRKTSFFDFAQRLVLSALMFTALSAFGIVVGVFSIYASCIFNILGAFSFLFLAYEALKNEWSFLDSSKILYLMLAGLFIIALILLNVFII